MALFIAIVFCWDQVVFGEGATPYDAYPIQTAQPATNATGTGQDVDLSRLTSNTTTDFLSSSISPLSSPQSSFQQTDHPKIYDETGKLRSELALDGQTIRHVYEGDAIQEAVDQSAVGDTVLVHAGTYHSHLVLKQGVNLKGEDVKTTIIHGDYAFNAPIIRAIGDNRIEGVTVTGARELPGQSLGAISIEGEGVKVRGNIITGNLSAGIYVHADATHILIEKNLFYGNPVAVKEPKDGNVIRYNTIVGYETAPISRITSIRYLSNQGFQLGIAYSDSIYSYRIEYSDDGGRTWKCAQTETSPGVFENQIVLANRLGITSWIDNGSATSPGPLDVDMRWYRAVAAESFAGKIGIEILGEQAPVIQNNIIAYQHTQSLWEEASTFSMGTALVEDNVLFHNGEAGDISGQYLPPAINPKTGEGWTGGNILADPEFTNVTSKDFSVAATSPAYGRGAFLPEALVAALDRASFFNVSNRIEKIEDAGQIVGYRVVYDEGSREEFYSDGRSVLDTTPPGIRLTSENVFVNQPDYELVYWVDGVEKREGHHLADGQNSFTIEAGDIFGNKTTQAMHVTLDRTPPAGMLLINDGDEETDSRSVVLSVNATDSSPLKDVRFSLDGGIQWTDWAEFSGMKVVMLSEGEGSKEILCQLRDEAGNIASFSDTIRFTPAPVRPVVQFLSASSADDPLYLLRYTVNGVEHQETWRLQPGENRLMVCASLGALPSFEEYVVVLNQQDNLLPSMPSVPAIPSDLVSLTAQNGLVLQYQNGNLFGIEKPGEYTLFDATFDAGQNLLGGLLLFENGDRLLYQSGKPFYLLNTRGEKTVYNEDGTVAYVLMPNNKKIRFDYRLDAADKVQSILSAEEAVTSLYDEKGKPVWIKKADGTSIFYQDGLLTMYTDASGNVFHYEVSVLHDGNDLTGYRSELVSVMHAGTSTVVPIATILADLPNYPAVQATLEQQLSRVLEYDAAGNMKKILAGSGETLELQNGLPVSLTSRSGELSTFKNPFSGSQDFFSVSLNGGDLEQFFGSDGQLSEIRLSDGTLFKINGSELDRIELEDGSVLSQLVWNGQNLTGFMRICPDGSKDFYSNSRIITRQDPQGTISNFAYGTSTGAPGFVTTQDGRTYVVRESRNAQGEIERTMELISIQLPGGASIQVQDGKPVQYSEYKSVPVDPVEVPSLLEGRFFVPLVQLTNAQLRELTVDQNGTIFSGQILFNDGTQYLIEDQKIVKQITTFGQLIELDKETLPPIQTMPAAPVAPLTSGETAFRDQLVETQLDYFMKGKGIHVGTGLPIDNLLNGQQSQYSQATLVGFWAEILSSIVTGDYVTARMSRAEALARLEQLLATYEQVQQQAGWNGMVSFFTIIEKNESILDDSGNPTGQTHKVYSYQRRFNQVGFGDVLNLSVSLSSVIGALQGLSFDPALEVLRDHILSSANSILTAQEPGYAAFYNNSGKYFRQVYKLVAGGDGNFEGSMDRVFNEFRSGMVWLAARYPQYSDALKNLNVAVRPFETQQGDMVDIAAPYDGGAFQMFWPLIHVDETQYAEFDVALRNFLYAQAEFVNANGIPGLLSAGDEPLHGYQGKIGLPEAAETDDILKTDIGSIYGVASAFPLAPHYALQFLKNLQAQFPGMSTAAGFVDAIQMQNVTQQDPQTGQMVAVQEPVFSDQYYGVDQAAFVLSLLKTSQGYFGKYLQSTGFRESFDDLYRSLKFNLSPVTKSNLPPSFFSQNTALLYDGGSATPDGLSASLIKQPGFISTISDPELGEGHVFNYVTSTGNFHHMEIEFGEGSTARRMNLQEYFLSPKHSGTATLLLGGMDLDVLNRSSAQGVFYTPGHGYSLSGLMTDPGIGQVRHVTFNFQDPWHPVGLWANYNNMDLSAYDFLSVPVKLGTGTSENVRLKFELKGTGEVFVTEPLTQDWQYLSIPIPKPARAMSQLAISIQPCDGKEITGDFYLGPLSALKIRTSNNIYWETMLGKSESEIRSLVLQNIAAQGNNGGWFQDREVLENFTIDSEGKLVNGVLKRADGGIQYFQNGQLVKWIFKNGRTVLFERGLASFVVDLARGKLETGRFYYDQNLRGEMQSFVLRDNESERTFGSDGKLKTLVRNGHRVDFENGSIKSISVSEGMLTDPEFSSSGELLKAHVLLLDGTQFDIDQTREQTTDMGNGVRVTYAGSYIQSIETLQNGRTDLSYSLNVMGKVMGVNVTFRETIADAQTGQPRVVTRQMSLFEFLQRPERSVEKSYLLKETPVSILPSSTVGGFSTGALASGEMTEGLKGNYGFDSQARYRFQYTDSFSATLGVSIKHDSTPVNVSAFSFLTLTLRQDPAMDWNQDFELTLKSPSQDPLGSFSIQDVQNDYQTFAFPMSDKTGIEGEIDLEVAREWDGLNKSGAIYLKDISYVALRTLGTELWEDRIGISALELQSLKIDADQLASVGVEIASRSPLVYPELAAWFDIPTQLVYGTDPSQEDQLLSFKRFDGSQVELNGSDVSRVTLPNGIVNEYSASGNAAQGTILGLGEDAGDARTVSYSYGALRKITQPDGREYLLSYEFDPEGKEITVFKDAQSGEERRFKDGKLISSGDPDQLKTHYTYENGELIGAELTYRDRLLNSTQYSFNENGTQVTDDRGTTWFYNANGELIKHMTRDGYLYEYSEYTQEMIAGGTLDPNDYKSALYGATGLRAVTLKGYQAADGSWISWNGAQGSEIHLASGAQGVNLQFDEEQRIESGQIQFPDGMILEIENFIPVRGRLAIGQTFESILPQANDYELLQDGDGTYLGFRFKVGEVLFTYNTAGELTRTESENGITNVFTYARDAQGNPVSYARMERQQIAFNGVPFPKEAELVAGIDQKLMDSGKETAVHQGSGFLVAVYKEATNQWDAYSGTFAVESDRIGLKHFLSEIKTGEFVAVVVSDPAFSQAGSEILTLLEGLGAGQVRLAAASNSEWSFFGNENLSLGQGFERTGADSFSTVTETNSARNIASGQIPTFANVNMFFKMSQAAAGAFSGFLKSCQPLNVARDLQSMTVYDSQDEIVFSRRLDGINSFYERGKVRETFDKDGTLLSVQEYSCPVSGCQSSEDMTLKKIALVKARQDFETQAAQMSDQIEQTKFDALYRLAWQDEVARLQIKENVDAGITEISSEISSLESQRFQRVKQCHRGFLGIGKFCEEKTYEVPGVQSAINQLVSQRSELMITGEGQLAAIPGAVAAKKIEIEQATAEKIMELQAQKDAFLLDILHQEMEPIITDFYRRILGRDASKQEFDLWVDRSKVAGWLDVVLLRSELESSSEKTVREEQKATIIQGVRNFLESYLPATQEVKVQLLQSLQLNASEVVALDAEDVAKILEWLESRDLHFGQSAFLSLKKILASKGIEVPTETIGKETVLIDILTGSITRFTDGDLLISMFAMDRTAAIHAKDFTSVKYSYQDLNALFQNVCPDLQAGCSLRLIAHVGEDHFVVVKRVTDTQVIYEETGKGAGGEDMTVNKEDFLKIWTAKDNAGYLMVSEEQAIQAKKLSDAEAMKIRGAFFFIFFVVSLVLTAASMVVSTFSPTFGKILGYAALVAGIIGIVGSLGQFIVQGVKMVFSSIAQQGIFATIKQGIVYVGKVLFESVKSVGRFIENAFAFVKGGFSGGFGNFGAGITQLKTFLIEGAGKIIPNSGGLREFTFAQTAARGLIAASLNMGVSAGLEGLGLDPRLTQLAAAFVGGAFLGIGQAGTSFIRSGLQSFVMQGVSQMGLHLGLAPPITDALSLLAGTSMDSLFNGNLTINLEEIAPTMAAKLTLGGLELLGRSMGLDPRITALIGLPIAASIGGVVSGAMSGSSSTIFNSIKAALFSRETLGGILSIGFDLASEKLNINPLFSALGLRLATAGVMGAINPDQTIMSSMAEAFLESVKQLNPFYGMDVTSPESLAVYFSQSVNFVDLIREKGLLAALDLYATSIFKRDAIESILHQGGLADILTGRAEYTAVNGIPVKAIHIDANNDLYFSTTDDSILLGRRNGNQVERGAFVIGANGKFLLKDGVVETKFPDGMHAVLEVKNGQSHGYRVFSDNKDLFEIYATGGNQIALNPDGSIYSAIFINKVNGARLEFSKGQLVSLSMTAPSGQSVNVSGMTLAQLTSIQKQGLVSFIASNGIWNTKPEGVSPDYESNLVNRLVERGVDPSSIFLAPMYENGNPVTDTFSWVTDMLGGDQLTDELLNKLDQKWITMTPAQRDHGVVSVLYSGSLNPFLKAIDRRDYNVSTIISLGGPSIEGTFYEGHIDNSHVKTFVNIYGDKDYVPLAGPILGGNKSFEGITTFNIKVLGADHFDYFPVPDGSNKIGEFVARLSEAAEAGGSRFKRFLNATPGISYDGESKTYIVNPNELIFDGGNT